MVKGLAKFREQFRSHAGQYVLIGGAACDLLMEEAGLEFRATKDLDIVLSVEALTVRSRRRVTTTAKGIQTIKHTPQSNTPNTFILTSDSQASGCQSDGVNACVAQTVLRQTRRQC